MNNPNFIDEEQVSGNGTSWILANTPIAGTVELYANGNRITVANGDFTISGKNITTTDSWPTGSIFADYQI